MSDYKRVEHSFKFKRNSYTEFEWIYPIAISSHPNFFFKTVQRKHFEIWFETKICRGFYIILRIFWAIWNLFGRFFCKFLCDWLIRFYQLGQNSKRLNKRKHYLQQELLRLSNLSRIIFEVPYSTIIKFIRFNTRQNNVLLIESILNSIKKMLPFQSNPIQFDKNPFQSNEISSEFHLIK